MKQFINKSLLTISFIVIIMLISLNIFMTDRNNRIIEENRRLQQEAENIKVTVSQFAIVIIHNLDLGLRGYALFKKEKYLYPLRFALDDKDSLMHVVERSLMQQNYALAEFNVLRDSMNAYAEFCLELKYLFDQNQMDKFERLSDLDKGYHLWLQYERFARKVYAFENQINSDAQRQYGAAMQNNYRAHIILLLIAIPTLLASAFHTYKRFAFEETLRKMEAEKAELLAMENTKLDEIVRERTKEIQHQNRQLQQQHDQITAQNEEIKAQNDVLIRSKKQQLDLYTKKILEKTEIIEKITLELESLKSKSFTGAEQVEKFNNILQSSILTDEDWENFKKAFEAVYPNFFAGLRYHFPEVTASEIRLAALIKMNLTVKEAAGVLGISAESVKKSRYRLKKKLELKEEDSLEEFVKKIV